MLDLVRPELERVDSRFLEPACGSGNFLVPVLLTKLDVVDARYRASAFEQAHQALLALMSIYGIELLADNVAECRVNLLQHFVNRTQTEGNSELTAAAMTVLEANIVHGDALAMVTVAAIPQPISFTEWSYLGKGHFHRRDFRLDTLTQMSSFAAEGTLFSDPGKHEVFTPARDFGQLTVSQIAAMGPDR